MNDDLISRQAAIKEVARWIGYIDEDMIFRIQTSLKRVPSAQPDAKEIGYAECSQRDEHRMSTFFIKYCPNCGAKLVEKETTNGNNIKSFYFPPEPKNFKEKHDKMIAELFDSFVKSESTLKGEGT